MARSFDISDAGLTERMRRSQAEVFAEDVTILEAQQRVLTDRPEIRLVTLGIDAGGAHARKLIERAEAASVADAVA
jgi:vanillate O-demethylase monooxygenase subunit